MSIHQQGHRLSTVRASRRDFFDKVWVHSGEASTADQQAGEQGQNAGSQQACRYRRWREALCSIRGLITGFAQLVDDDHFDGDGSVGRLVRQELVA